MNSLFYLTINLNDFKTFFNLLFHYRRLTRSKRDKPKSVELYNQIGNFWRVKGDTQKCIECFRRALAVSPNNAEVLLNLVIFLFFFFLIKLFCRPQSLFFPLFKACPQFLIMEIYTLKPLKLRIFKLLQSLGQALRPASMHTPS